jgi:PAS domain S-box-containing protein
MEIIASLKGGDILAQTVKTQQCVNSTETGEIQRLLDELQFKQLDLEMQHQTLLETLEELEESRNRYATFYDFAPVGYVTFDYRGCIQEINLTGASLIGKERFLLIGTPFCCIVKKSDMKLFLNHLRQCNQSKEKVITELNLVSKYGSPVQVQLLSVPVRDVGKNISCYRTIIIDITERKLIENELARLERLNIIGEMAASIAHEIRNPMTTVRGFLQLFRCKNEFMQHIKNLDLMTDELDRANLIISEFLALGKNKAVCMNYHNLNTIVKAVYPLLKADALRTGKNIKLKLKDIPDLLVDEKEMRQVIFNLANNGIQAMSSEGTLTIKTYVDSEAVILSVHDQGTGIQPDLLERLGTPFLTTKENGTGLGLAVCYSIADRHNAVIKVNSVPWGTTFSVRFKL